MALIEGLLKKAQVEPYTDAGKPTASDMPYRMIWVTDLEEFQISNGATWVSVGGATSAAGDTLVQQLDSSVAGITAGEAITANDACVYILHNGTGSDVYRVFKTDADFGNKNSFSGFAVASASVTPNIKTYTLSAALIASNVCPITVNTRNYSVTFATDSDTTLAALATQIATDQDVQSATVTSVGGGADNDRVITITSKGGLSLSISGTTITGGVSQATVTVAQTQAASGGSVDLHQYGPLAGFTGLTTGSSYYISATAGGVTASPSGSQDPYVGQALSSTILFVNPNNFSFKFRSMIGTMVRFTGYQTTPTTGAVDTSEHFNFSTWSTGSASGTTKAWGLSSEAGVQGYAYQLDGQTSSASSASLIAKRYNLSSWSTVSNRTTAKSGCGGAVLSDILHVSRGTTGTGATNGTAVIDTFNGASWTNTLASYATAGTAGGSFTLNSIVHSLATRDATDSDTNAVHTWNGSSISTTTNFPINTSGSLGASVIGSYGLGLSHLGSDVCNGYKYTGTTWSSDIGIAQLATNVFPLSGPCIGYDPSTNRVHWNGGASGASVLQLTTQYYTGTSVSTGVSSAIATSAASGGTI